MDQGEIGEVEYHLWLNKGCRKVRAINAAGKR